MPTMAGAFAYDLYKNVGALDFQAGLAIAVGFVVAFLSAVVVVRGFLDFVSRHGFVLFAWWRIAVGIIVILAVIVFGSGNGESIRAGLGEAPAVELAARPVAGEIGGQDRSEAGGADAESLKGASLGNRRL
jgi:hypothetical protein